MGEVTTEALFENFRDAWNVEQGTMPAGDARRLLIPDALVDTGATLVSMPPRLIEQIGLRRRATKRVRVAAGRGEAGLYGAVRLTIQGRTGTTDVLELADDLPVLIGQLPLENLDFVVDPREQKLIGNPAHEGEHVFEVY